MGKADEDDDKNKESFFSNRKTGHFWCVFYQGLGILEILKQRDSWLMRRIVPVFSQALTFFFFLNTGTPFIIQRYYTIMCMYIWLALTKQTLRLTSRHAGC